MALDATVRSVVKVAYGVTKSLQETVQHYAWTSQDGFGAPNNPATPEGYAAAVPLKAIVVQKLQLKHMGDGRQVAVKATLTFLQVIAPNGAAGRDEPIDPRDKLVLADGTTGPILRAEGMRDPGKGRPFLLEVWLGMTGGVV